MYLTLVLSALSLVLARSSRDHRQLPTHIPLPTRPLEWKDLNFISTSDTHGWLLGHQHATWPEPNYSGDYGSFASFVSHMRFIAEEKGVDLLVVDAGDHHDGSGLVSSSPESAAQADEIFSQLTYDILTIGNHELYSYASAKEIYDHRERWRGRYLTSNVNITVLQDGNPVSTPIGERYAKFKSNTGRKVTAFGVIFDFFAHDKNLTIQSPSLLAQESWFLDAIEEAPDYFVLAGHMPPRFDTAEWQAIFDAIRQRHPTIPIFIFGGHNHIRDCVQYDDHSIAVVPGRYLETVAFTSSSMPDLKHPEKPLDMTRRYLDANPYTYRWHTNTTEDDFDLPIGRNITFQLLQLASELDISRPLGIAPKDLFLARYPYGHPHSILTEWGNKVLPATVQEKGRSEKRLIITQTGSIRFDLFQGTFNRNDELTLSPFANAFMYITLPGKIARKVLDQLNRAGASKLIPDTPRTIQEEDARVERIYQDWLDTQAAEYEREMSLSGGEQVVMGGKSEGGLLTMGYVTRDACPGKGDDIEHTPLPRSRQQPDFISTPYPEGIADDELLDVIVMDFALDDFVAAVNFLDPLRKLTAGDMAVYAPGTALNRVWGEYAKIAWQP
ncbi:putative vacuolar protein [Papiliotrema laurentii]|uniref:Vacuolar protein n=1 Tax=Papiliotrema laurentii TaxID=5418 RepID=A0AAD9L727_PAPLA|nr:putative vacuolar protein [Papiliotrema laurentii]